jgi:polar amino acid transport system substrate-binding protein
MSKQNTLITPNVVPGNSLFDQIEARGTIRFAVYDVDYGNPPEMYRDRETGEQTGVAIELCRIMAKDLGVEPEWVELPWEEQLPALLDGRVDLCIKHTNTPERALSVEFAGRLMRLDVVLMVRKDSSLKTLLDLNRVGIVVAHETGSSIADVLRRRLPLATLLGLEQEQAMLQVVSGEVNAFAGDTPVPLFVRKHPEVMLLEDEQGSPVVISREYGHPAIRPGDPRFLNWLNNWVSYYTAQGLVEELWDKYMREWLEAD